MPLNRSFLKKMAKVVLDSYVIYVCTLIAPPVLAWLFLNGHRDLASLLLLVLQLPMLIVLLVLERHDRRQP